MVWSKEKITGELDEKIKEISSNPSPYLKIEYLTLLDMLSLFDEETRLKYIGKYFPKESIKELYEKLVNDFRKNSFEDVITIKDKIAKIYTATNNLHLRPSPAFYKSKASEEEFLDIVCEFFKNFPIPMYELFLKLLKENIYITKKDYGNKTSRGICFHTNECYLTSIYKDMRDAQILPHEIAHAYQIGNFNSKDEIIRYHFSTYREVFPRFLELAFIHENIKGTYRRCLLDKERDFYDTLIYLNDYYVGELHHINGYDMDEEHFTSLYNFLPKTMVNDILSRSLAMYFYSIYLEDKDECIRLLTIFNENVGRVYDSVISEKFLTDDAIFSIKKLIDRYPLH